MNESLYTKSGILLNAVKAPYEIFMKLCENYEPDELLSGNEKLFAELGLNKNIQLKLSELINKNWLEGEMSKIEKFDAEFITAKDIDYPAKLKDLPHPPIGLYVKGNLNISLPSIAIVGTRKCSDYARNTATNLAKAIARKGIIIISGGARGIDTAAHRGCLDEDGKTIAVFGTGIDKIYPAENRDLFLRILDRGALISEFPMGMGGTSWHFPMRNRIIVALASRVIVAESPEGGGAMLTARESLKLGRETWSIPGRIVDEVSKGTNMLLNEGAKSLVGLDEFIETITGKPEQLTLNFDDNKNTHKISETKLTDSEKKVYSFLQRQGNILLDSIVIGTGLDFSEVQEALITLEAEGFIINSSGRYSATI